ncbi:hypothetical protein AcV5_003778 [Taiwanofungus camphoratus]|nr:hypothetical protein AcV5_003778 [Antrodia cinnamomea]
MTCCDLFRTTDTTCHPSEEVYQQPRWCAQPCFALALVTQATWTKTRPFIRNKFPARGTVEGPEAFRELL